ncbi:period circadian protein homolog 2 isoform X2 [Physeter macrocephalus]|uniref:Period circadian protein homolog 2 n=1 Tax=Physeter macrocephalus TaxID=9755 RepID=A0A455AST3_PHYMC|nr:period circadian protein homolog 2 isoform X2 [Physeter catodon]|eukprot:XP_028338958.1 period circadian protein homolog 2 isoform X2 [Physeter catodon]
MNGCADYAPSPSDPPQEPVERWPSQAPPQEDANASGGTSENGSTGRDSRGGDCGGSGQELGTPVGPPSTGPGTFSLMMVKSEHHPSASGCSSEQSTKVDAHKELIKTLKELKVHLPADKRAKGKASTLLTLKHALRSVKQVKANEEYYQLLASGEDQPRSARAPALTVEEIESVTSEFTGRNADMFAAAVSLVTGKILYISDQVVSLFRCKRGTFHDAKFVEFLAPQDVGVFHSCTTPCKLPPWGVRRRADSFTQECMEEKSFFCRVSVGKNHESEIRYHPFRMTPYLAQVRDRQGTESQLCCVLLAERVHSGYEAPRIPPEKRIFTTTHSPNCLFQDVDERAVPLLGHLPQDLIETPVLVQLHPSDRPLMVAIHKKIVQSGGQPFDYSPIRFRARNGEYITLDTSWSSFINPWSRKISFIIGRHRVRVGPLNEDVFSAQPRGEEKALQPGTQELTEQIHRLLVQPVPPSSSSGYGSLGSSGSHEHLPSQTSSSECTGQEDPCRRRAEICKNGNKVKSKSPYPDESGEQKNKSAAGMQSSSPAQMKAVPATEKDSSRASLPEAGLPEEPAFKNPLAGSYQQISCLDSVIRYLESCSEATTLKRKCEFPAHLPTPKVSDKRKATAGAAGPHAAETVADAASGPESLACPAGSVLPRGLGQEQEPFRKLGLTKEVLAAHTQKEEQSFLLKFREIRKLNVFQSRCHYYLQDRSKGQSSERAAPGLRNTSGIDSSWKKTGKNRKLKSKRVKPRDSSGSTGSGGPPPQRLPLVGLNATAWSPSDTSQCSCPAMPFPGPVPAYSLPAFPPAGVVPAPGTVAAAPGALHASLALPTDTQREFAVQPPSFAGPLAPVVALVLPSCSFPPVPLSLPPAFFPGQPSLPSEVIPASQPEFPGRTSSPKRPHTCPPAERGPPGSRVAARAALPSAAGSAGRTSPPLFLSRGSSPLQLDLLQLDEAPEGGSAAAGPTGPHRKPGSSWARQPEAPPPCDKPKDAQSSDALSTSSGPLRLLLHEDLCLATGSAPSGSGASATSCSLGPGSLGCDASRSGAGGGSTSHTSTYFGSMDSSESNRTAKAKVDREESEHLKHVLQDPVWLPVAGPDDSVTMAYRMPSRNLETVLQEDREKLKVLQRFQPRFTDRQKQELQDVHPWMRSGGLPAAIDVAECVCCENKGKDNMCVRYEEATPTLGLSGTTDTT